jgi:transcriptional regulator GlxA family with amidase domain
MMDGISVSIRLQRIEQLLMARLRKSAVIDFGIARAAAACDAENRSVRALAKVACLSTRQLERRFERTVGVSPKQYARIRRFHRASQAALQLETSPRWGELAAECGYFDQSHMNRDFQQFAELTPVELWRRHHDAFFQDPPKPLP